MICERCEENEATIHITELVKDVKSEVHLCERCAKISGLNPELSNFSLSLPEMLSFLDIGDVDDVIEIDNCETCGLTYIQYRKIGKLGCPDCYKYMWSALEHVVFSYHHNVSHIGKSPSNYVSIDTVDKMLLIPRKKVIENRETASELKKKLEIAVYEERYEDAAKIRDKIKNIDRVE